MLHSKFRGIGQPVTVKKSFEGFLPFLGMAASWSCDKHHINKFSLPCT